MTNLRLLAMALLVSGPAFAQDLAKGDAITAAISGNTVQGSMVSSGVYAEFYGADGVIKGKDYAGKWSVEGDTMCFSYGEAATCYGVRISGDQVTWVIDGKDDGVGTIVTGNPNAF